MIRTVGIIGCGLIARPVIRALVRGQAPGWKLGPVLARSARPVEGIDVDDDPEAFFDQPVDLIIEAAGPDAVRTRGVAALRRADVWSVSGTALADPTLFADLEEAGAESGHRLRLVPGAIAGLDGVATLSIADDAVVETVIDLVPKGDSASVVFTGTVAEAAEQFPNHVNVAVATGLAGLGVDRTEATVRQPKAGEPHTLSIHAASRDGSFDVTTRPVVSPSDGIHVVASSLIAALRRESQVIWVG